MKNRQLSAYIELAKPRIVLMSLIALAIGFIIGGGRETSFLLLVATVIGAGFVGAGASALNHYMERDIDGMMVRTRNRPLPTGVLKPSHALMFGIYSILAGLAVLLSFVNLLTAFLLLLSAFLYVLVYTPLKRVSWLNTTVGAIPGAIPPLAGWAGATGELGAGGVMLFAILFAWQHTHFYAIAWMYREDYAHAGFRMLSTDDTSGRRTAIGVMISCVLLLAVSLAPGLIEVADTAYTAAAIGLGGFMAWSSIQVARQRSYENARGLLKASVYYLPALLGCMMLDHLF